MIDLLIDEEGITMKEKFINLVIKNRDAFKGIGAIVGILFLLSLFLKGRLSTTIAFSISAGLFNILFIIIMLLIYSWIYKNYVRK